MKVNTKFALIVGLLSIFLLSGFMGLILYYQKNKKESKYATEYSFTKSSGDSLKGLKSIAEKYNEKSDE